MGTGAISSKPRYKNTLLYLLSGYDPELHWYPIQSKRNYYTAQSLDHFPSLYTAVHTDPLKCIQSIYTFFSHRRITVTHPLAEKSHGYSLNTYVSLGNLQT